MTYPENRVRSTAQWPSLMGTVSEQVKSSGNRCVVRSPHRAFSTLHVRLNRFNCRQILSSQRTGGSGENFSSIQLPCALGSFFLSFFLSCRAASPFLAVHQMASLVSLCFASKSLGKCTFFSTLCMFVCEWKAPPKLKPN